MQGTSGYKTLQAGAGTNKRATQQPTVAKQKNPKATAKETEQSYSVAAVGAVAPTAATL